MTHAEVVVIILPPSFVKNVMDVGVPIDVLCTATTVTSYGVYLTTTEHEVVIIMNVYANSYLVLQRCKPFVLE